MNGHFFPRDEYYMRLALREAEHALDHDDVPVGAVIVKDGEVIGAGHNERELRNDPTAHAEMLALHEASQAVGSWRVLDAVMYVTLEPCTMCAAAISFARIRRLYYGASDPKGGAVESGVRFFASPTCHHIPEVYSAVGESEAAALLREFFRARR
jgi:tRNA(adenine34) deaminase